jgi:hypothetical protein
MAMFVPLIRRDAMKKIYSTLLFVFLSITLLFAQPKKGSVILGGDLGLDYIKYSNNQNDIGSENFVIKILPEFGFFTNDKVAIGINAGIEYGKAFIYDTVYYTTPPYNYYSITQVENKEKFIVLQPFVSTYHFFSDKIGIKNYFFAGVAFGSGIQMYVSTNHPFDNSVFRVTAGYGLKFLFFLKESMALNLGLVGLQYLNETVKYEFSNEEYKVQHLQMNSPFKNALSVGLEFYLTEKPAAEKK